jgi:hypothetical protein
MNRSPETPGFVTPIIANNYLFIKMLLKEKERILH